MLTATVSEHTVGGLFALDWGWTQHLSGRVRGRMFAPRRISTTSCTPPGGKERLIVAWDSLAAWTKGRYEGPVFIADPAGGFYMPVTEGRLTELEVNTDHTTSLLADTQYELCDEMGGLTAAADCSVIGVLCRSKSKPADVPGAVDFVASTLATSPSADFGWTNTWCHREQVGNDKESGGKGGGQCPSYDTRDDNLYLLEFTGTTDASPRTDHGAQATVCVNKAIGGYPIGNWAISLDKTSATYVLDIKVTAGGHEGSANLAINRDATWSWNEALTNGWACGTGHTEANQLTYSPELGTWARLCWTDNNDDGEVDVWASYFQTLPSKGGSTTPVQILKLPGGNEKNNNPNPLYEGPGGVGNVVSLGASGWMGVGYRPAAADAGKAQLEQQLALTVINFPPSSTGCTAASPCLFTELNNLPGVSKWNYDGSNGALGFVNMQTLGPLVDQTMLVGYATKVKHMNEDYPPLEYRIAKVSTAGEILATKKLEGTGWGEEDVFLRLTNGCVLFAFTWDSAPGALYGNNGADGTAASARFSNKLRTTVVCDE